MFFLTWLIFLLFTARITSASIKSSSWRPENYAVLVEGIFVFYPSQANVAHAYQVLIKHGVPPENIITIMFDDAAYDITNPYPGKLYNEPDGPDVYAGLKVDYRLYDVTINNFIAVLEGNASAIKGGNGRVLESGPNDNVFVYMSAVGGAEAIFGRELLTPSILNRTLTSMYEKKKYGKLVFYLDDTTASDFFEDVLSPDINIYALASSSRLEYVSCPLYCGTRKLPENCLATEFSHYWMKDAESNESNDETLNEQYQIVRQNTQQTHVMQFGDLSIGDLPVALFQGERP